MGPANTDHNGLSRRRPIGFSIINGLQRKGAPRSCGRAGMDRVHASNAMSEREMNNGDHHR
jgi:hypothetical protein